MVVLEVTRRRLPGQHLVTLSTHASCSFVSEAVPRLTVWHWIGTMPALSRDEMNQRRIGLSTLERER
jgi:hypothetical protein